MNSVVPYQRVHRGYRCPVGNHPVFLADPPPILLPDGTLALNREPLFHALHIHVRTCPGRRR